MNLYSDLHIEISPCEVHSPCIIAGDIAGTPTIVGDPSQVYSIAGNHDLYSHHVDTPLVGIELQNESVQLDDGRVLFGGTMWTEWAWHSSIGRLPRMVGNPTVEQLRAYGVEIFAAAAGYNLALDVIQATGKANFELPYSSFAEAMREGNRYMNDYRYGRMPYNTAQRLDQLWTINEYRSFIENLHAACLDYAGTWEDQDDVGRPTSPAGENVANHMLIMSHHCPISRGVILRHYRIQRYDQYPQLYPAYYSPAISRLLMTSSHFCQAVRDHGMTWCYGHTHEPIDILIYPFDNVAVDDLRFYNNTSFSDTYLGAIEAEVEWRVEVNTNINYIDIPGVIRVVSNPRGYSTDENFDQRGDNYASTQCSV